MEDCLLRLQKILLVGEIWFVCIDQWKVHREMYLFADSVDMGQGNRGVGQNSCSLWIIVRGPASPSP